MKINDVTKKVDASYNTVRKFIEKDATYHKRVKNILHVTEEGIEALEEEYGLRSEVMSESNIDFYRAQVKFLHDQLDEAKRYNQTFTQLIEMNDEEKAQQEQAIKEKEAALEERERAIKELEKELHQGELEKQELKHQLDLEKNKSFFQRLFKR